MTDTLEPNYGGWNYGTVMLADAQLRGARRTGDQALADAALRHLLGLGGRPFANNAFGAAGAASVLADGRAGALPADAWARLSGPVTTWSRSPRSCPDPRGCCSAPPRRRSCGSPTSAATAQPVGRAGAGPFRLTL